MPNRRSRPHQFLGTPAFQRIVPTHPRGTDPSQNSKAIGQPALVRSTVTYAELNAGGGRGINGQNDLTGNNGRSVGIITCTFANLSIGDHAIFIDGVELRPGIDFAPGANDNDLASNLAAAIAELPGFDESFSNLAVVTVIRRGCNRFLEFRAVETGAASAFALTQYAEEDLMQPGFEPGPPDIL